jgi:hypothetical protein
MTLLALALLLTAGPASAGDPDPFADIRRFQQEVRDDPPAGPFFPPPAPSRSLLRSPLLESLRGGGPQFPAVNDPARPWIRSDPQQGLTVDLRRQWDYLSRNQGIFGSCTAFATVALFEAAMFRESQACYRLSEADLYMQHNVLSWGCWDNVGDNCEASVSGSNIRLMSEHVRTRGVLNGDHYQEFMGRFLGALQADAQRARAFAAFYRNPFDYGALFRAPRRVTRAELADYASASRRGDLARERASVAQRASRFEVVDRSWTISTPWEKTAAQCRWDAREQEKFIDGELLRGRPVAVSMALNGLAAWNRPANAGGGSGPWAWHAFVINGMRVGRNGAKFYTTRNSWGGQNPTVAPTELCRIDYAQSLLAPGELPAAEDPMDALLGR